MDELRRHAAPLLERWQRLARGQQLAMIAVLVATAVGFFILLDRNDTDWQPICDGREFSSKEISAIQSCWREHGLKTFRRDGNKLSVPQAEITRYEAVVPKSETDEAASASEWDKQLSKTNLFTSREELEQRKENALRHELRRHLEAIPAIAKADVIWARSRGRTPFASRSKVTATINVTPRDGYDLTPELAQSLRTAVARMVPDLNEEDIAVLDQSTGLAVTDETDDLIVELQRNRQRERLARQLESRMAAALTHIPGAIAEVHWGVAATPNFTAESPTASRHVAAKPTFDLTPDWSTEFPDKLIEFTNTIDSTHESSRSAGWHINVRIPLMYLDAFAARQLVSAEHLASTPIDELRDSEHERIRQLAFQSLPLGTQIASLKVMPFGDGDATALQTSDVHFAAWPHFLCFFVALLCVILAVRRPRLNFKTIPRTACAIDSTNESTSLAPMLTEEQRTTTAQEPEAVGLSPQSNPTTSAVSDLARLQQLDPQELADALRHEHPQAIAVLLTRCSTRLASACLSRLASSLQTDVIRRLKSLGEVPDELVTEIAHAVCLRLSATPPTTISEPTNRIAHLLPDTASRRVFA